MSAETLVEALAEIDRLRGAIKAAYHEGAMFESRGDLCWDDSDAKAAIWSTAGSVDSEALVEALVKAGVVDAGWFNEATDAGTLLRISARFASPEAKREVLRTLLGERLEQMADPEGDLMVSGWREDGERGSVWVTVPFLRDLLAPLEAP